MLLSLPVNLLSVHIRSYESPSCVAKPPIGITFPKQVLLKHLPTRSALGPQPVSLTIVLCGHAP